MHSKLKPFSYHGVVWADAAGYYSYLPMWFIYGIDSKSWPEDIDKKTGNGFRFDSLSGKLINKYFSGVAILQAPFFLVAHAYEKISGRRADGFSKTYIKSITIASTFYTWMGLVILFLLLKARLKANQAMIAMILVLAATNLYYYSITANGMSHAYSFFLFCTLLFTANANIKTDLKLFLTGLTISLIILCRPTNFLIIPAVLFMGTNGLSQLSDKLKQIKVLVKRIHLFLAGIFIPLIPQLLYLKKTYGSYVVNTYSGETFSNWMQPKLPEVWFSPQNGLFIYTPFMLLSIFGIIAGFRIRKAESIFLAFVFIALSYICASWWNWWFGCSYGARNFVEFHALFIFPAAGFIFSRENLIQKIFTWSFVILCVAININMLYYYDGCFYGNEWDWKEYLRLHHFI